MHEIEIIFKSILSIPNNTTPLPDLTENQISANDETEIKPYQNYISEKDISHSVKRMSRETSPAHDKVLISTLLTLRCDKILRCTNYVNMYQNYFEEWKNNVNL